MDTRNFEMVFGTIENKGERLYFDNTTLTNTFLNDLIAGTVTDFSITNFFTNITDYVTAVKYIPLNLAKFLSGDQQFGSEYLHLGTQVFTDYQFKTIYPKTWQAKIQLFTKTISRTHNNFLDFAPYTKVSLYVPYFELIELDPVLVMGKTITGYVSLDVKSGMLSLYIENGDGVLVCYKSSHIAIDLSLGKGNMEDINRNNILQTIGLVGSLTGLGIGVASGNPLITAGSIGLATKNVAQAMTNNVEHLKSYHGGNGNRTELVCDKNIKLIIETVKDIKRPLPALKGLVLKQSSGLDTITGYTEISYINFNPSNNAIMEDEIDEIVGLLRDGVIL